MTGPLLHDFEDGTTQGWFPFGSPSVTNSTEVAFAGSHSLKTAGRTATFMGPGVSLTGQLDPGVTYRVSVAARLAAGEAPTTVQVTMMRTLADGTNQFDTVVPSAAATGDAWVQLTGTYSFTTPATGLILYVESASATASYYIDAFSLTQTAPAPLSYDFEDGSAQGWFPFGSPTVANSTDVAFAGTHSLKTTGRTASFMGPGLNLQGQLTKGATYQVTLSVRLVTGEPASTLLATVMRTPEGGSAAFDTVATAADVTDQAWVTVTGLYSFTTDNSGLIFYVQSAAGTASYYVDGVSFAQVAPPAGPPGNTTGAATTFETSTTEGWTSRTGGEAVAASTADAHGGSVSLLTTNRSFAFQGPAFDVTNVMFNGSRYDVSLWAKLGPGQAPAQLRVSLERRLGTATQTFHSVVGNTTVTADGWVRLQATYNQALANSSLVLYVESDSGTAPFFIDDFSITYVPPVVAERDIPSVFQTMAAYFPIGAAVIPADIAGEPAFLLSKHFNSLTSGNDMKWDATEPTEGNFAFAQADAEVLFARTNNMQVRGHTLVWHNQTPAWVFRDAAGNPMTPTAENKALLLQRMRSHIQAVVTHFGNDVATWDVVNEAIDPGQPDGYRRGPWFDIIGPEYIEAAFRAARAASPTAKLYLNDYDSTNPLKRDFLLAVVRDLKSRGVPIDGMGHQMHHNIEYPSVQSVIDAINLFATAGVTNSVTELDVSVYSGSFPAPFTSYGDIPPSRHAQVGYSYLGVFEAFKQLQSKLASVTIWGTSDDKSWLTSSGRVDAPLLFDPSLKKKPAYWAIVDPLQLPGADLSTAVAATPASVVVGQPVAFVISVTNNADADTASFKPTDDDLPATNLVLTTAVPSHMAFQSLSTPGGWSCATPAPGGTGPVICTVPALAVGAAATFTLAVAPNDCATPNASFIVASARVTSATPDPNPASNNTASASVQLLNAPPVITAAGALSTTVECATAFVDPGASAQDTCDGPVPVVASGAVNVSTVGTYAVVYNATDSAGGRATPVVRTVHVADTTAPVIVLAGANPARVECKGVFTEPGASATDSCAGALAVMTSGAVNTSVPGSYTRGYTAIDPAGNATAATRIVTVSDGGAPRLDPIDLTILARDLVLVVDHQTITVNGRPYRRRDSRAFELRRHDITFDGTHVRVNGHVVPADGRTVVMLPPGHQYQAFTVEDLLEAASDACDASVDRGDAVITQITSDEREDGRGHGDGHTLRDIVISGTCRSASLRVERDGRGNGRVYTVTLRVKDHAGNPAQKTVTVRVPPNDDTGAALDDGPKYTVASACQ